MVQHENAKNKTVFLTAGGTGGHVFPAEALGQALKMQGYDVHILTDKRARRFINTGKAGLPAENIHVLTSATFSLRHPLTVIKASWYLGRGFWQARRLVKHYRPRIIIGFGGYPTLPPILAAQFAGVPIVIHEQNSVMGRANRFLARYAKAIATSLTITKPDQTLAKKMVKTGNPLRQAVIDASKIPYSPFQGEDKFNLLIFGGSQGASFFTEIVPQALDMLPEHMCTKLKLVQQVRRGGEDKLRAFYAERSIEAIIAPFFENLPELMAQSQFIIARAGASTVAEMAAIGRPGLLVPYPGALDHDQRHNGQDLARSGGVDMIEQENLTVETLQKILIQAFENPKVMQNKAANVAKTGEINATEKLVSLVKQYQITNSN